MAASENFRRFLPVGTAEQGIEGPTLASAVAFAVTHRQHVVSGAAAMTSIALPWPGFAGEIVLIPTGAFTGALGGAAGVAIGLAFTAVVGKALTMTYSPSAGLWYPSY